MHRTFKLLTLCSIAILPLAALSGCGFAPLYAQRGLTANMSQIAIEVPQTRTAYFLEQNLRNGFGSDEVSEKAYLLTISMKESQYSVGLRVDDTSTRSEITNSVSYVLKNIKTGKIMFTDGFSETVTYDTSISPLTGVISQQDAQERIAGSIAQKIQGNLAIYFHESSKPKP